MRQRQRSIRIAKSPQTEAMEATRCSSQVRVKEGKISLVVIPAIQGESAFPLLSGCEKFPPIVGDTDRKRRGSYKQYRVLGFFRQLQHLLTQSLSCFKLASDTVI